MVKDNHFEARMVRNPRGLLKNVRACNSYRRRIGTNNRAGFVITVTIDSIRFAASASMPILIQNQSVPCLSQLWLLAAKCRPVGDFSLGFALKSAQNFCHLAGRKIVLNGLLCHSGEDGKYWQPGIKPFPLPTLSGNHFL